MISRQPDSPFAEKHVHTATQPSTGLSEQNLDDSPLARAQRGVDRVEATTLGWNRISLIITYILLWGMYLLFAFERSFNRNLGPYITSDFNQHSLLPTVDLVASILGGVAYLPMAKVLNIYGRPEGLVVMSLVGAIGLILTAACTNIQTYCAGVVFTTVGFYTAIYAVDVITADTSMLKSRALAYAFTSTPYIITAFGGPAASQSLLKHDRNWRWGFGALVISVPVVVAPLAFTMFRGEGKAIKSPPATKTGGILKRASRLLIEFDAAGIFVLAAGEALFLLPFNLAGSAADKWASPYIVAMLVLGFLLLVLFPFVERWAPAPFAPWKMLTSGTVLIICIINALFAIAEDTWSSYFTSYLQVVYGLSVSHAGYINGISSVVGGIWQLIIGLLIRWSGRFRWLLLTATPIYALFVGLLIYFRTPSTRVGLIIMCQFFLSFASKVILLCVQVGVVSTVQHSEIATAIALLGLSGSIGFAIGDSISGAIWTNTLPQELARLLPETAKAQAAAIYGSLTVQLSYPLNSPVRNAIIQAYAIAQTRMLIASVVVSGVMLFFVLLVKDVKISDVQQVRGTLL
ncbi:hypothetical protein LTS17_012474 [Exophiala oligosperma]